MSRFLSFFIFLVGLALCSPVWACDACACTLARCSLDAASKETRVFTAFTFEELNWDKRDAAGAHRLHHQGHHVHNKTHEQFYRVFLGFKPFEALTFLAELPYVVRNSTEIDSHANLGAKETSEGLGDLKLSTIWRFLNAPGGFLGPLVGVKLPAGETDARNSQGRLFEPELQPGSGSVDPFAGAAFAWEWKGARLQGNAVYTEKTQGAHNFEYGDAFSSYLILDREVGKVAGGVLRLGVDANLQMEEKEIENGVEGPDSGGTTVLLGPAFSVKLAKQTEITANFLYPVYQSLGGVHQELDFAWNASIKIGW